MLKREQERGGYKYMRSIYGRRESNREGFVKVEM
jgi:hypothetical protein